VATSDFHPHKGLYCHHSSRDTDTVDLFNP
jgi:hypothetical protein